MIIQAIPVVAIHGGAHLSRSHIGPSRGGLPRCAGRHPAQVGAWPRWRALWTIRPVEMLKVPTLQAGQKQVFPKRDP